MLKVWLNETAECRETNEMKKLIILLVMIAGVLLIAGCCGSKESSQTSEMGQISAKSVVDLSGIDNGTAVEVALGGNVILKLDANPSTGYNWKIQELDEKILPLTSKDYQQNEAPAGMVGVPGVETFSFKAIKKGETILSLVYSRGGDIAEDFQITVTVK